MRIFTHWLGARGLSILAADVGKGEVQEFIGEMVATRARGTAICRYAALAAFFSWAKEAGLVEVNPVVGVVRPKPLRPLPRFVPEEVLQVLMDHLRGREARTHKRDLAIIELLYSSGLRIGEICALNISDLNLTQGTIITRCGKGGKDRVSFCAGAVGSLKAYLAVRSEFIKGHTTREDKDALFLSIRGRRMTPRATLEVIADLSERIKLPRITPHQIRHSMATHSLDHGMDIRTLQELLGHESLTTTQRYCAVSIVHMRAEFDRTHPLMRNRTDDKGLLESKIANQQRRDR